MNALIAIHPYFYSGLWVFDDQQAGLVKEPFVSGMPEIIEHFIEEKQISNAKEGFTILFAGTPFPDSDICLTKIGVEYGGTWYEVNGMKGWLCPALFKYFDKAPDKIYVKLQK
jgi:hypothetical protein